MINMDILIKSALLHDIGKVCIRADHSLGNHSKAGTQFIKKFLKNDENSEIMLKCIQYHHGQYLKNADVDSSDLSYIVYEADNIAAGMDRRDIEGETKSFDAKLSLNSVFNIFGDGDNGNSKFYLRGMNPDENFNYSCNGNVIASSDRYKSIVDEFESNFQRSNIIDMRPNELLRIMEDLTSYIPSSTNTQEVCDISLFIHSKVTAAIASCMYRYFTANKISDYKKYCFSDNKSFRKNDSLLLVSGDISGIQDFIYTVPSKGALKSLRGRSFFLEILMENFIDELLESLNLSRANILYSGGGHFYLLADNTQETKALINSIKIAFNKWLFHNYGTKLYLALGYTECSAEELMESKMQRSIFASVSKVVNCEKLNRYDEESLKMMFGVAGSEDNLTEGRECGVCHTSSLNLIEYNDAYICHNCLNLYKIGELLLKENAVFVVSDENSEESIEIFAHNKKCWLHVVKVETLKQFNKNIIRLYSKNKAVTGEKIATRLWLADYSYMSDNGKVTDLKELADLSCNEQRGIIRLGVLRADVDNLGAAFISGFINSKNSSDPAKYATFSRYADLSRDMVMFFKLAVNKICQGSLDGMDDKNYLSFNMFGINKGKLRKIHIVYSGGDDMFLVGAWDDLIELAVDIRRAFSRFTNNKLSFSAGMALFSPAYPISKMAELTGMLEDAAKNMPEKDSIALFGFDTEQKYNNVNVTCKHIYKWNDFINNVCKEKLDFLMGKLDFDNKYNNKLPAGKTLLYRLMELTEDIGKEKMNLARFAYTLARMQPTRKELQSVYEEFSSQIYKWVNNENERKELHTALNLLVYYLRDGKEE